MLIKTLRRSIVILLGVTIGSLMVLGAYKSTQKSLLFPNQEQINNFTNVGAGLSLRQQHVVIKSRQSAVQLMSFDPNGNGISASSGIYIVYEGNYFILTTSHGIGMVCELTQVVVDEQLYDCVHYTFRDPQTDYIIIQIEPILERTPVRIPADLPHRQEWIEELAVQTTIFYTGFPNQGGPYTFDGKIVGYQEEEAIFIDSYGWSGSSGAGVFSESGNLIGWVMALEVGETYFGREVLENFIWVIPLFKVDWLAVGAFAQ